MTCTLWALEVHKLSLTLKPAVWAQGGSSPAKGLVQLRRLSDCVRQEEHCAFFSKHFRHSSSVKLKLHCSGLGVLRVRAVPCCQWHLTCHQGASKLKCPFPQITRDFNAQEREAPGKYKFLLLLCLFQHICLYFTVPFSGASSLPEDLGYNPVVPLKSLQLEAM